MGERTYTEEEVEVLLDTLRFLKNRLIRQQDEIEVIVKHLEQVEEEIVGLKAQE